MTAAEDRALDAARCRRCGGTGSVMLSEMYGFYDRERLNQDEPVRCPRCAGEGTEPMSVAEIISAGIRARKGTR